VPALADSVRTHCAAIARRARWVQINPDAATYEDGIAGLHSELHLLDAPPEDVARYILVLDAINFGSGWFDELGIDTDTLTRHLTAHARDHGGTWTPRELRAVEDAEVAGALQLEAGHLLTQLYTAALNQLGLWLGNRSALAAVESANGSAQRLAEDLAAGMPFYGDLGFYKRAQITANDLALAGVVEFSDVDRLTVFADNVLPHVLRTDGVLEYAPELAEAVDSGRTLPAGSEMEAEVRACAVHACELLAERAGVPPRTLDNWLWNRGAVEPYASGRPHQTRTVFY
jgi:hypothetical protein